MSKYRVFAFSEQSIKKYSGSAKQPKLCLEKYPEFDTIIMFFVGSDLVLKFLKNGKKTCSVTFAFGEYPKFHVPIELAETKQPEQKEEPLFQVGDRVYDWHCGWMTITEIKSHGSIFTVCDKKQKSHNFFGEHIVRLSFTEYNFITGGWSQERPPQIGSFGWFWEDETDLLSEETVFGKLQKIEDGMYFTKDNQYSIFSTKNPFEK